MRIMVGFQNSKNKRNFINKIAQDGGLPSSIKVEEWNGILVYDVPFEEAAKDLVQLAEKYEAHISL